MNENTTVIEINGVKLEVDLRTAKRIDTLQVGTRVKVLKKQYGNSFKVLFGIIIGFDPFKELPTIVIATADVSYGDSKIEFLYYNAESKDVEVVVATDDDALALDKEAFLKWTEQQINRKQAEIKDLEDKRDYFLGKFSTYWTPAEKAASV